MAQSVNMKPFYLLFGAVAVAGAVWIGMARAGAGGGAIEIGPRWRRQMTGAHCSTQDNRYNEHGIGICLVGDFQVEHPTPAQMASLVRLVGYLSATCGIAPANIRVHGDLKSTLCPGKNFSMAELQSGLAARATPGTGLLSARP